MTYPRNCYICSKLWHRFNIGLERRAVNLVEDILDEGEVVEDEEGGYDEVEYAHEDRDRVNCIV